MTTQSYYKDRLGFDPREALYESADNVHSAGGRHSSSPARHHHHSSSHHYQQYHQQVQQHSRISVSPGNHYDYDSPAAKKQRQSQGGYEDALTQFKGTMSIWEYFIENTDMLGRYRSM